MLVAILSPYKVVLHVFRYFCLGPWMTGAEYQSGSRGIFSSSTDNQNVPCAVCLTSGRSANMMYPAKRTCPAGWVKEYEGTCLYLFTVLLISLFIGAGATTSCDIIIYQSP